MTLTSNGAVENNWVDKAATKSGGKKVLSMIAYITVVLNGDTGLSASIEFKEETLDTFFPFQTVVGNEMVNIVPEFPADGKYRLPLPFARNEDAVRLTFNNAVNAAIDVQFVTADIDKQID